jgi:DNA-binding NarL/FixJ family response regulator
MTPTQKPIRICIIEDEPIMADGIAALLRNEPVFQVVGIATERVQAVEMVSKEQPDITLLDMRWAGSDIPAVGLEILKDIRAIHKKARVLVLSGHAKPYWIAEAKAAGARGYLSKGKLTRELLDAIRLVHDHDATCNFPETEPLPEPLTLRENIALQWMAKGLQDKEIAPRMGIRESTVGKHTQPIFQKLGVNNRVEAINKARALGLLPPD